jgi:acetylornithine deacetylase/succinyl-diaminopimelate desuccinylase-like protein
VRSRLDRALEVARAEHDRTLHDLARWVAIPSISGDRAHRADVLRSARWLRTRLRTLGADVERHDGLVVAAMGRGGPGVPTVVLYGHHDVVAAGAGWSSSPFDLVRRRGPDGVEVRGRGVSDDKGPLVVVLAALRAWTAVGGVPCRVVVVADGAEEIGSPGLRSALESVAGGVRADAVLVLDTERCPSGAVSLTTAQRGRVLVDLVVDAGRAPVHPGRCGGSVVDPGLVLARNLAVLADRVASVAAGGTRGRAWVPSVSVLGLDSGDGSAQVPAVAGARLDVRVPPGVSPAAALAWVRRGLVVPSGGSVRVRPVAGHAGFSGVPPPAVVRALEGAGSGLGWRQSGAGVPASGVLAEVFGVVPALVGLTPAGSRAHGPDERFDVRGVGRAVEFLIRFLDRPLIRGAGRSSWAGGGRVVPVARGVTSRSERW